jgi:hypothetical protein
LKFFQIEDEGRGGARSLVDGSFMMPYLPSVKFETYLLAGVIIFCIWSTRRSVQRSQSKQERFFAWRTSIFSWFVAFLVLAAFVFLPAKALLLLLIPVAFGGLSLVKFLRDARARLRRENEERVDIDRMKRIN